MLLGDILIVLGILCSIYFMYKGSKLGASMMLLLVVVGFISIYGNEFKIALPTLLIIFSILCYKAIIKTGDKEKIAAIRLKLIVADIVMVIFQILMIYGFFFRSK